MAQVAFSPRRDWSSAIQRRAAPYRPPPLGPSPSFHRHHHYDAPHPIPPQPLRPTHVTPPQPIRGNFRPIGEQHREPCKLVQIHKWAGPVSVFLIAICSARTVNPQSRTPDTDIVRNINNNECVHFIRLLHRAGQPVSLERRPFWCIVRRWMRKAGTFANCGLLDRTWTKRGPAWIAFRS